MSKDVFVEAGSFRRLLIGAAEGPLCPLYGSPMGWDGFGGKENG